MYRRSNLMLAALGAALALAAAPAIAAEVSVTRTIARALPAAAGQAVAVDNLLGRVTIEPTRGTPRVVASVRAGAADRARARALAKTIRITTIAEANSSHLRVEYPLARYSTYHYAGPLTSKNKASSASTSHGLMTFLRVFWGHAGDDSSVRYDGHKVRLTSGPSRDGVALQVDLAIYLPADTAVKLNQKLGAVRVHDIAGDARIKLDAGRLASHDTRGRLDLTTGSADIAIAHQNGPTRLVTGSGDIAIHKTVGAINARQGSGDFQGHDLRGKLTADTGSGDVKVRDLAGGLDIHTGSGDLHGRRLAGGLTLRAGSGDVDIRDLSGGINIHTGSGDVNARGLGAASGVDARTGSGDITLAGDLSGLRDFSLAAGSGDIVVRAERLPTMRLIARTSSGDINATWPNPRRSVSRKGYFAATYGNNQLDGRIKTGSGDITLSGS